MSAEGPRTSPDTSAEPPAERPSLARTLIFVLGLSALISLVLILVLGRMGMRKHRFEASLEARATAPALFGAIIDPDAVASVSGAVPGFGQLRSVRWDRSPQRGAIVTEVYDESEQVYSISEWDPPTRIEERYELVDDPRFAFVEQRWTIRESNGRRWIEVRNELYPKSLLGGFLLQLASEDRVRRDALLARLRAIDEWALAHPLTSTTAAVAKIPVVSEAAPEIE